MTTTKTEFELAMELAAIHGSDTVCVTARGLTEYLGRMGVGCVCNPGACPDGPRMIHGYKIKIIDVTKPPQPKPAPANVKVWSPAL